MTREKGKWGGDCPGARVQNEGRRCPVRWKWLGSADEKGRRKAKGERRHKREALLMGKPESGID